MTKQKRMVSMLLAGAVVLAAGFVTVSVMSQGAGTQSTQDKSAKEKNKENEKVKLKPGSAPAQPLTSEQLALLSEPGETHHKLKAFAGTWSQEISIHEPGSVEPTMLTASATYESTLGGRYMLGRVNGKSPDGKPFEGIDIVGYDAFRGEYTTVWLSTNSTTATFCSGKMGSKDDTLVMNGKYDDTRTGEQALPIKMRTRFIDENTMEHETMTKGEDGKFTTVVTVKSKRVK